MQNIDYNLTYMRKLRATMKDIVSKTKHNSLSDPFIELTEGGKALFFVITLDKGSSTSLTLGIQPARSPKNVPDTTARRKPQNRSCREPSTSAPISAGFSTNT